MKPIIERSFTGQLIIALVLGLTLSPFGNMHAEEKGSTPEAEKTLKLPPIFGDHMVLQRDGIAPVWGKAAPGA